MGSRKLAVLPSDPYESARVAGLRYVSDQMPGITRRRAGKGFVYTYPQGHAVRDAETLQRIRGLVIPPAWTNVWICPAENGHLQAVGMDARGRKQYRYHAIYRQIRDATKYTRMLSFGAALPKIRAGVQQDLKLQGVPRRKVLATVVHLLESTCIRVGNEEYKKQNESFGLTTLQDEHVEVKGSKIRFQFKGKSGQMHDVELQDRRLARIVLECQCIPGDELFQYQDEDGQYSKISSEDVNSYLQELTGEAFTAKDFRTWHGTREAAIVLAGMGRPETQTQAKKFLVEAVKTTARRLNNRPATCRKYYIHPAVLEAFEKGTLGEVMGSAKAQDEANGLSAEEVAVMKLLEAYVPERPTAAPKKIKQRLGQALRASLKAARAVVG